MPLRSSAFIEPFQTSMLKAPDHQDSNVKCTLSLVNSLFKERTKRPWWARVLLALFRAAKVPGMVWGIRMRRRESLLHETLLDRGRGFVLPGHRLRSAHPHRFIGCCPSGSVRSLLLYEWCELHDEDSDRGLSVSKAVHVNPVGSSIRHVGEDYPLG